MDRQLVSITLNNLAQQCREANDTWWRDLVTGERITRNKGELINVQTTNPRLVWLAGSSSDGAPVF